MLPAHARQILLKRVNDLIEACKRKPLLHCLNELPACASRKYRAVLFRKINALFFARRLMDEVLLFTVL
jgi:hypothetical protein